MSENIELKVFNRKRGKDDETPWQADIWADGSDHHGIGKTPHEALLNATIHWNAYEARKAGEAGGAS